MAQVTCAGQLCSAVSNARRTIIFFCFALLTLFATFQFGSNFYVETNAGQAASRSNTNSALRRIPSKDATGDGELSGAAQVIKEWAERRRSPGVVQVQSGIVDLDIAKESVPSRVEQPAEQKPAEETRDPNPDAQKQEAGDAPKDNDKTETENAPSPPDGNAEGDNSAVAIDNKADSANSDSESAELCPETSPHLVGPLKVNKTAPTWEALNAMFPQVKPGGLYKVTECKSRHNMAIVIPYRNRDEHLRIFLQHMVPIFIRQQLDFGIYVAEQMDGSTFNRGMMMNVGFVEALKVDNYACFIFTDVDLLIEDDRNIYGCPEFPRHMSVAIDTLNYRLPYATIFGGTENFRTEHYKKVNGFSNKYFGWGGEDDDLYQRVIKAGLKLIRPPKEVARYTMATHKKERANPNRFRHLRDAKTRMALDGLNTLKYDLVQFVKRPLITTVSVKVDQDAILKGR